MGLVHNGALRWLPILVVLSLMTALVAVSLPQRANAAISRDSFESCLLEKLNVERAEAGAVELQMAHDLVDPVRDWSQWMRYNGLQHMPSSVRNPILPDSWTSWGENIAWWSDPGLADCSAIHDMWMNSSGHRSNILDPGFRYAAIGAYVDGSGWWATQLFFSASQYSSQCNGTFCDDDTSIYEGAIEKINEEGITKGCNPPDNTMFCPNDYVTRGQMAAFLSRAFHLPASNAVDFIDDDNSIFEASIQAIAAASITHGCNPPDNTMFCPNDYVTRGQMAAFLSRAFHLPASNAVDFIDDDNSIFEASIQAIAAASITHGCNPPDNTKFCPNDYVTRGQMAAFLARALGL